MQVDSPKKLKIALLFSGQPRDIELGFLSIQQFLFQGNYDVDVFAHLWLDVKNPSAQYEASPWASHKPFTLRPDTAALFESIYSPKKIVYEPPPIESDIVPKSFLEGPIRAASPRNFYNIRSNHLSIQRVTDIFMQTKGWETYDFVVRTRTDIFLGTFPDLTRLPRNYTFCVGAEDELKINMLLFSSPHLAIEGLQFYELDEDLYINKQIIFNCEQIAFEYYKHMNLLKKTVFMNPRVFSPEVARYYVLSEKTGRIAQTPSTESDDIYKGRIISST